jgi:hypothetical protein
MTQESSFSLSSGNINKISKDTYNPPAAIRSSLADLGKTGYSGSVIVKFRCIWLANRWRIWGDSEYYTGVKY